MSIPKKKYEFSELDWQIIDLLKQDGRASNQSIADRLNVSTAIVTARIKKMEQAKAMKITAVIDFAAFGHDVLLPMGVDVRGRKINDVAEDLAAIEEVTSVQICVGQHDIELLVVLADFSELPAIVLEKLANVEGVYEITPATAVDIVKFQFDVVPL